MDLAALFETALAFVEAHRAWAGPIFALLAFGESLVIVGVLIPATGVMMAAGTLIGTGTLPLADVWIGGALGAALGDTVSYWVGRRLGPAAHRMWPFSRHPEVLAAADRVFARWGWAAVVIGRFIGPLRASVPTAAGIAAMPNLVFQAANVGSAILWIPVLVLPGSLGAIAWDLVAAGDGALGAAVVLAVVAVVAGVLWLLRRFLPGRVRD